MLVSIGKAAQFIGVSISTLRRWEKDGKFNSTLRTIGKHRRYCIEKLSEVFLGTTPRSQEKTTIAYARVSSHDQKADLKRQVAKLDDYCAKNSETYEVIEDLGSGINFKKKGLNKLIQLLCLGRVSELVLTHRDRLLRFGAALLFKICDLFGTKITILEAETDTRSFEEQLAGDVIEIMTVYSAKIYGKRSHANRRAA